MLACYTAGVGVSRRAARAEKARAAEVFAQIGMVVGIGITRVTSGYGLKVNLRDEPEPGVSVPQDVNGVPVVVEITGPLRKR